MDFVNCNIVTGQNFVFRFCKGNDIVKTYFDSVTKRYRDKYFVRESHLL